MKNIMTFILVLSFGFIKGQRNNEMKFDINDSYKKDSMVIRNSIEFYQYSDSYSDSLNVVKLKIKITNLGNIPIPNLRCVANRSQYLKLYFNDKNTNDLSIFNGEELDDWPKYLKKNESDSFETNFILKNDSGIFLYENPIKIKWSYLGMDSPVVEVDVLNRKIITK